MTRLLADLINAGDVRASTLPCAYVSAVCVDGFRDTGLYNGDHGASNCSRTVIIAAPQQRWSHWKKAKCT